MNLLNQLRIFKDKIRIHATMKKEWGTRWKKSFAIVNKRSKTLLKKMKNKWFVNFQIINVSMFFLTLWMILREK